MTEKKTGRPSNKSRLEKLGFRVTSLEKDSKGVTRAVLVLDDHTVRMASHPGDPDIVEIAEGYLKA